MKHTIYFIVITALFIACKQNVSNEVATEEALKVAAIQLNTDSAIATISESTLIESKLDLPFIGKRRFNFLGGAVTAICIEIKPDGTVLISSVSVNFDKNDNPNGYREDVYFKGKYSDIIKETPNGTIVVVKESADYTSYYKIERDMIYMVDKNGIKDKNCGDEQNEICGTPLEKI